MRDSRPQLLDNFFDDVTLLRDVQQRALALLKLNKKVTSLLPKQLKSHCRVANYRNGILILETNNANWLMGLRYEQPKLLSALRTDMLPALVTIEIKINPAWQNSAENLSSTGPSSTTSDSTQVTPGRQISLTTAQNLQALANHCPDKLRQKLERLVALAGESAKTTSQKN